MAEAVIVIAAVEEVRQSSIPGGVLVEAGIQKIYWNGVHQQRNRNYGHPILLRRHYAQNIGAAAAGANTVRVNFSPAAAYPDVTGLPCGSQVHGGDERGVVHDLLQRCVKTPVRSVTPIVPDAELELLALLAEVIAVLY